MSKVTGDGSIQHWVWVTSAEYYLDEDGLDSEDLDPALQSDPDGWWTCHKNTQRGDLVLLYRSRPKKDIGYLIQAESDAYSISDDEHARDKGWDYGCNYRVLYKFRSPLTLSDLRCDPYLDEWGALRGNFQQRVYSIQVSVWQHLMDSLKTRESEFASYLKANRIKKELAKIILEEELEQRIVDCPEILRPLGYDLEIRERQFVCAGHGGRIDLLCFDRNQKRYVVIELKNVRAGQNTFGQISTYLGWVKQRIPNRRAPEGLVIARGFDSRFLSAAKTNERVRYIDMTELGFK